MNSKKITKVAIFIDYDNFTISYENRYKVDEKDIVIWDTFSHKLLQYYQNNFIKNDFEIIEHTGTWLSVGISDFPSSIEREMKERFRVLDRKTGFIIKYGNRTPSYKVGSEWRLGKEKGVDAEIICQMLMGSFQNHFDACILVSDDSDYVPAARRIQEYFGKKVIQAGFKNERLREHAFAHIPFESTDKDLTF